MERQWELIWEELADAAANVTALQQGFEPFSVLMLSPKDLPANEVEGVVDLADLADIKARPVVFYRRPAIVMSEDEAKVYQQQTLGELPGAIDGD